MILIFTAVVGILNKHAVAIAADSAVTLGGSNGRKILNKANKMFALSKFHPVGIMIYNSATFMGTPWETIIKIYRNKLIDKSLDSVQDYQEDFIKFLREHNFFCNQEEQLNYLGGMTDSILRRILSEVSNEHKELVSKNTKKQLQQFLVKVEEKIGKIIEILKENTELCIDFNDYTFDSFEKYSKESIKSVFEGLKTETKIEIPEDLINKFQFLMFLIIRTKQDHWNYTGLIFTGFGEKEIYPNLIAVNISLVIDDRLHFYTDGNKSANITNQQNSAICPFAQTDVIDTILSGIDPSLDEIYLSNFQRSFVKYNEEIIKIIGDTNPELVAQIESLDIEKITNIYTRSNNQIRSTKYIRPLMGAVSTLSKEDLAEMAESLIYLTYLKRRITFAEESVGGPVDVAIISKGDGFIWIKRKHYFDPDLNKHFLINYL